MRRRDFIAGFGGAALYRVAANAQPSRATVRIGALTVAAVQSPLERAVIEGLRDYGYIEGQNLTLDYRYSANSEARLARFAAELVTSKPDVVFASGSEATTAIRRLTTTIPIVMTSTNPVGLGFVASLARPGGNITGLSIFGPEVSAKRLELLRELLPRTTHVAAFWNPVDPGARFSLQETESAAGILNIKLQAQAVRTIDDFAAAMQAAEQQKADAVILLPAPLMSRNAAQISALAAPRRLPTLFYSDEAIKAGGLMSYGPSLVGVYRRAGYFIDRILKGASPAELPVEQPSKFELSINLKTAKAIGVDVPPTLLARADNVIE